MMSRYGPDFRDDENLLVSEVMYGSITFSIFEDVTSGTNHSIVLLRPNARGEQCVVLTTPPAAQLEPVKRDASGIPLEFRRLDQAPPGMPANDIIYRRASDMRYRAAVCRHVTWKGQKMRKKRIACDVQYSQ